MGRLTFLQVKADDTEQWRTKENVDAIIKRVQNNSGQILMPKTAIPNVGWITNF